jgi:hypothetical protein
MELWATGAGRAEDLDTENADVPIKQARVADSAYVRLFVAAAERALRDAGHGPFPEDLSPLAGVACLTDTGDGQVERWAVHARAGKPRPSVRDFGGIVHNSAAGRAALRLGLKGPQLVLTSGDVLQAAKVQLLSGRASLMVVGVVHHARPFDKVRLPAELSPSAALALILEVLAASNGERPVGRRAGIADLEREGARHLSHFRRLDAQWRLVSGED